jgi:hypothetical protein
MADPPKPLNPIPYPGWLGQPLGERSDASSAPGAPNPAEIFHGFEPRPPQRALDPVPGSVLTPDVEQFVTIGVHGDFNSLPLGTPGDASTKLLWTIDDKGGHFVPETMPWDSSRGIPSHTNISPDTAYFAGEAWRTGPNEITINSGSRGYGYNWQTARDLTGDEKAAYVEAMQARYDRAAQFLREAGFEVKVTPLGQR